MIQSLTNTTKDIFLTNFESILKKGLNDKF